MACHGPSYLPIYRSWTAGLTQRLDGLRTEVQTATAVLASHDGKSAALADVQSNLALLERGKPIHNPRYALAILQKGHDDVVAALTDAGQPAPPTPWTAAPYQSECLQCHFGIELLSVDAFGKTFSHTPHTVKARLRCTACHGDLSNHGTVKLHSADDCTHCHEKITHPMDVAAEECLSCHTADIGPVSDKVNFPHAQHIELGLDCGLCHTGVANKRHRDFARSPQALPKLGHEFCSTCHAGDVPAPDGTPPEGADCTKCHVQF